MKFQFTKLVFLVLVLIFLTTPTFAQNAGIRFQVTPVVTASPSPSVNPNPTPATNSVLLDQQRRQQEKQQQNNIVGNSDQRSPTPLLNTTCSNDPNCSLQYKINQNNQSKQNVPNSGVNPSGEF